MPSAEIVNIFARVLQAEKEGLAFFERAGLIANDPRVKDVFERLAKTKREHLGALEEGFRNLDVRPPLTGAKGPPLYPLSEVEKAECYVCGYAAETDVVPDYCPRCGASRYAFQKEFSLRTAWEIAEAGIRGSIDILVEADRVADARLKQLIQRQIALEQGLLEEARRELRSSGTS